MQTGSISRQDVALDALPVIACMLDRRARLLYGNAHWRSYAGEAGAASPGDWTDALHDDDRDAFRQAWAAVADTGEPATVQCRLHAGDGIYHWVAASIGRAPATIGNEAFACVTCADIDDRVLAENDLLERLGLYRDMLNISVDCIKVIAPDGAIRHLNRSGCIALGLPVDTRRFGMKWLDLLPAQIRRRGQRALRAARSGKRSRFAGMSELPGRPPRYWDNILTPLQDGDGRVIDILCVSRDLTQQHEVEQRLRAASEVDELTGLANRRVFRTRLKRMLARARDTGRRAGLLIADLDHFKHINDTLGHAAGDHLLRVVAQRLSSGPAESCFVARLGGDEFAIVVDAASEQEVMHVASRILQRTEAPVHYGRESINCGISAGCAIYPEHADDVSGLMKRADTALNDLKAGGRGGIRLFDRHMMAVAERAAGQVARARVLLRERAVQPFYQPKVRLEDGTVFGYEALLRWRDGNGRWALPHEIGESFKDYELATGLAELIHERVLSDLRGWIEWGLQPLPVSVNVAPVEFLRDDFGERMLARLQRFGVPTRLVELEITEHVLVERGAEHVIRALRLLKAAGVRIALDDFCTGHSSFTHLRDYPVDCLKVDMSFVERIVHDDAVAAIVQAVVRLGPSLSLDVIAEGIETGAQRELLARMGCTLGQGFLFGRPMPAAEVERSLAVAVV